MSGSICGYVVQGQRVVADAAISVMEGPGPQADIAPVSDADGWFALDGLPAGRWRLRALGPDGAGGEAIVEVWDDSLSEVTLALGDPATPLPDTFHEPNLAERAGDARDRPGSIVGAVTDAVTGEPLAGALVIVTDGPGPLPDGAIITDANGCFVMPAMEAGEWALHIDADEHAGTELVVAVVSDRRADVAVAVLQSR